MVAAQDDRQTKARKKPREKDAEKERQIGSMGVSDREMTLHCHAKPIFNMAVGITNTA